VTSRPLPRSAPSAQGVAATGVAAFVDALETLPGLDPHGVVLVRHGHVVAEGWWAPYTADQVHLLYSLSKSFTSTAVALAVAEGLLDLDDTVLGHFPELDAEVTDPRARRMRVRHVAAMASGHHEEALDRADALDPADLVRGFLLTPPDAEPGTVFAYNQPCTYTLGAIVARAAGTGLTDYLRPRLFDPLGIGPVAWARHRSGQELGFSGLYARTEDVAKLGLLYLQRGVWQGRQLIPAGWVAEATRAQVSTGVEGKPDWQQGYGFQFWRSRHGFRGDGAFGQFCVVLPDDDAVLAVTAATEDMQAVLDAAWEHLLPALRGGTDGPDADAELAARTAALHLPPVAAAPAPDVAARWDGFAARTAGPSPVSSVQVTALPGGQWRLTLGDAATAVPLSVPVLLGTGDTWAVSEPAGVGGAPLPLATSGGWTAPGTLRFDVASLQTPHRISVTCDLDAGTVDASWVTTPLWDASLATLCAPHG